MRTLITRQRLTTADRVHDALIQLAEQGNEQPSVRELMEAGAVPSQSMVAYALRTLEAMGVVTRTPNVARGVRLVRTEPVTLTTTAKALASDAMPLAHLTAEEVNAARESGAYVVSRAALTAMVDELRKGKR